MKITNITIRKGATVNIGQYESFRVDVELGCSVGGTDVAEAYVELRNSVEQCLRNEIEKRENQIPGQRRAYRFAGYNRDLEEEDFYDDKLPF